MRAVIDTNVLISGMMGRGTPPQRILKAWGEERFTWLTSVQILAEYSRVVNYPKVRRYIRLTDEEVDRVLGTLWGSSEQISVPDEVPSISPDPDDDRFVACALAGGADVIVSGDGHLLNLGSIGEIPIVAPTIFLALLGADDPAG